MRFLSLVYKAYWALCLRYPPLVNAFYRGADNPFLMKVVDRLFGTAYLPRFAAYLKREQPDVVVSTYFTFTHYLETLKHVDQLHAAAVVLMAPIGISVAQGMGVSIDPFLMAITIGASCAFLTPIGHQSNTLVMGPGGYKFGDYWRMGLVLEVIVAVVAIPLILVFWPL